jgi:hypothetical protein
VVYGAGGSIPAITAVRRLLALESLTLKIGDAPFAQMRPGIGRRAFPGRPVAGGDAGVGTAGRLAQGGERLCRIGGGHALEAERGGGIEEAIRERPTWRVRATLASMT